MTAYQNFAALYDSLMDDFDYDAWSIHYAQLLGLSPGMRVAELGCGTGAMSVRISRAGYTLTATDISPDMLEIARQKAMRHGTTPQFALQDMTRFALPRPVHAIFCACDGVGYLDSLKKVEQCFTCVCENLRPGGAFAFDICTQSKLTAMDGQMYGEDREEVSYIWMNALDVSTRILRMELTFFVRQTNGLYKKFSEEHVQRAHSIPEIVQHLERAGFVDIDVLGGMQMRAPEPQDTRIHFVARKP